MVVLEKLTLKPSKSKGSQMMVASVTAENASSTTPIIALSEVAMRSTVMKTYSDLRWERQAEPDEVVDVLSGGDEQSKEVIVGLPSFNRKAQLFVMLPCPIPSYRRGFQPFLTPRMSRGGRLLIMPS